MTHANVILTLSYLIHLLPPLAQAEVLRQFVEGLLLLIVILVVGTCLVACFVLLNLLLPNISERSQTALLNTPWRAFFIGFANYLFLGGISLLLFTLKIRPLSVLGLMIVSFLLIVTLLGLQGLVKLLGERLAAAHTAQMSPLRRLIWAAITLELAGLLPFVGWFVLTPSLLMTSFGAAVLGWLNRQPDDTTRLQN